MAAARHAPYTVRAFLYPLDALKGWNRLYGKAGFVQYQFVLPKQAGVAALREVLAAIAGSGRGSFLAVLKTFGPANANYLSFPIEGYTLALDFKVSRPCSRYSICSIASCSNTAGAFTWPRMPA